MNFRYDANNAMLSVFSALNCKQQEQKQNTVMERIDFHTLRALSQYNSESITNANESLKPEENLNAIFTIPY